MSTERQTLLASRFTRQQTFCAPAGGFTLVELLVTVGIIAVLISIFIPVLSKVRTAARASETRNRVQNIANAIQSYYQDFSAYPGPFSNAQVHARIAITEGAVSGPITMSENLVLGLLGGLNRTNPISYSRDGVGLGAISLAPLDARKSNPYLDVRFGSQLLSQGRFVDEAQKPANDSPVPEFVDGFLNPLPILYLRAGTGLPGVMTLNGQDETGTARTLQYDLNQIIGYTGTTIGIPNDKQHGLNQLGTMNGALVTKPADAPNAALPYFRAPGQNATNTPNASGITRQRDGFILISAGADRIFGTTDDITNFGGIVND